MRVRDGITVQSEIVLQSFLALESAMSYTEGQQADPRLVAFFF